MATIVDPELHIEPVTGKPGQRRVRVTYEICTVENDVLLGSEISESVVVHSVDLHDATSRPRPLNLTMDHTGMVAGPGAVRRTLSKDVNRVDLDVQQDWWRTDHGGGVLPIAEFPDHVMAEITMTKDGQIVAEAATPVVNGSWGALGDD